MNGIVNVLKPTGMTSHDVVSFMRKLTKIKKIGHAGTLDPNVSGVLPICIGKATKISDILINGDKEYICEIRLGKSTDTQDMYGKIDEEYRGDLNVDLNILKDTIMSFKGRIKQIPPKYSALKVNGKKMYEYARQNIDIEKAAREIDIKDIEILRIDLPNVMIKVRCSKGTYMRTLCYDIGQKLGIPAHMGILIRTQAKGLKIEDAFTLEQLKYYAEIKELEKCLIPIYDIVVMQHVYVDDKHFDKLTKGNEIFYKSNEKLDDKFYVFCCNMLIGTGHAVDDNHIKVDTMLI